MTIGQPPELSVSEFVALCNQTLEFAYPEVTISGELANFHVSKRQWVYFDLKDELASVKFFGTVYQLPGPLEDGLLVKVCGQPRLHPQYGFSVNVRTIQPTGEGAIRRAAELLKARLAGEGLFADDRKRTLPYPPTSIGLITAEQSAAYADFVKILNVRWRGVCIHLLDIAVQGQVAPEQIVGAIKQFNTQAAPPDVLVLIRGGGSTEDLAAYNTETVTRAVAASRVPTLVAIGHEIDLALAELAADRRASTPSNAAELLVPDRQHILPQLQTQQAQLERCMAGHVEAESSRIDDALSQLHEQLHSQCLATHEHLLAQSRLLAVLSPETILRKGYAIVRSQQRPLASIRDVHDGTIVEIQLQDGRFSAVTREQKK